LLSLFDVSKTFHNSFLASVEQKICQTVKTTQMLS